jgi:AcrR family transcriptional regulator
MSSTQTSYGDPQTRSRILQATWELIEERGANFKLSELADKANVSRQAIYLHFGDRTGLLIALVKYMDKSLGLAELLLSVVEAPTGIEALNRLVEVASVYNAQIDPVARVLEAAQYDDEAIAAAWRNRMRGRHADHRAVIQRIADEGKLADAWTVDAAADLFYTTTMPGAWRELTRELGWTPQQYIQKITSLLRHGLLTE